MKKLILVVFVTNFLLSACNNNTDKIQQINERASLPASFKFSDLGLKVMASFINKKNGTTSVLYANNMALIQATSGDSTCVVGEVMALVTWKQKADDRWFGAQVPGNLQSVELVNTTTDGKMGLSTNYKKYIGEHLLTDTAAKNSEERIKYISKQQPSIMP